MKSSFSALGNCVDVVLPSVTALHQSVQLRDTKDTGRHAPTLYFTRGEWEAFILGAKAGEFDYPTGP